MFVYSFSPFDIVFLSILPHKTVFLFVYIYVWKTIGNHLTRKTNRHFIVFKRWRHARWCELLWVKVEGAPKWIFQPMYVKHKSCNSTDLFGQQWSTANKSWLKSQGKLTGRWQHFKNDVINGASSSSSEKSVLTWWQYVAEKGWKEGHTVRGWVLAGSEFTRRKPVVVIDDNVV